MQGRNVVLTVAALVLLAAVAMPRYQLLAGQTPSPTATRVAVVDLVRLFNEYERTKQLNEDLAKKQDKFKADRQQKVDQIDVLRAQLENFQPGSKDYKDRQEQLMKQSIELEVFTKVTAEQLKQEFRQLTEEVYNELVDQVGKLAKQMGYDLVLHQDAVEIKQADDFSTMLSKIKQRKVIYCANSIDITDHVIAAVNNDYRLRKAKEKQR